MEKRLPVRPDQLFESRAVSSQGFVQQLFSLSSIYHLYHSKGQNVKKNKVLITYSAVNHLS